MVPTYIYMLEPSLLSSSKLHQDNPLDHEFLEIQYEVRN